MSDMQQAGEADFLEELALDELDLPDFYAMDTKAMLEHPLLAGKPPKRRWFESERDFWVRVDGLLGIRSMIHILDRQQKEADLRQSIWEAGNRNIHRESGRHGTAVEMEYGFATVLWDGETEADRYVALEGVGPAPGSTG
jgi:hypothetical protein